MHRNGLPQYSPTVVVGAGQSGLSVGYHLARRGLPFIIVDANERVGDTWRNRWDSLRLFTPAVFNGLPEMPFPGEAFDYPRKDEMADYLESYATRFNLPVYSDVRVDRLHREGDRFVLTCGGRRLEADSVIIAMSSYQRPHVPEFAADLDPHIRQIHAIDYKNPSQLQSGDVLIVGAGNSGADIAMDVSRNHLVWLSGRDVGAIPFRIDGRAAKAGLVRFVIRVLYHRVLTVDTPIGRKIRPKFLSIGGPLIRVKPKDLERAGISRVPRVADVVDGKPRLIDGRILDVENVIWCTGFHAGLSWIDLPIHGEHEPQHDKGVVTSQPGLYFVGLHFLYSLSSSMIHGVNRDAERIVEHLAERASTSPMRAAREPLQLAS